MKKFLPHVSDNVAIRLLKWCEFFYCFLIILPVILVLYQSKGISVGDFFLIQGLSRLATFAFEIPSGYLSDTFSRRKVLMLGAVVYLVANAWIYLGVGFWNIACAEMLLGLSMALFSGTKESYAYDLLKRMGREKEFLKENGSINSYAQAASFIASIAGGVLYSYIGDGILLIEIWAAVLALGCAAALPELVEIKRVRKKNTSVIRDVLSVVKMSVKHPEIKWFMIFPSMFGSFTLILMWMLQPVMESVGVAVALFGIFVGLNQFSRWVLARSADAIFTRLGAVRLLKVICVGIMVVFAAILLCLSLPLGAWTYVLVAFIVIGPALQKLCSLVFSSFIHERIKSTERGTVMSVDSMMMTAFNAAAMFAMKPLLDGYGIFTAVLVAACAFLIILWPLGKVIKIAKK